MAASTVNQQIFSMAATSPLSCNLTSSSPLKIITTARGGNAMVLTIQAQKKAKKTRKIILREDVAELGKKGELLEVRAGFYRNYLLPLGRAQIVTPLFLKEIRIEEERIEAEKRRVKIPE